MIVIDRDDGDDGYCYDLYDFFEKGYCHDGKFSEDVDSKKHQRSQICNCYLECKRINMEHLANCHGEWNSFLYALPGLGILIIHGRNHIWNFWKFLCGIWARVSV